ncbi:MAG: ABC transporter permease subunit [Sulfurimonas sp.]
MKNLYLIAYLDLKESIRAKWFLVYSLVFGGLIALFFIAGVTESQVMGFSGLSRLLLMYIQITIVILPIFILITTVRSISGDRDNHILEYMLSFPISLKQYYWGKIIGRFITVYLPVLFAMIIAIVFGFIKGAAIPWSIFFLYTGLLFSLSSAFLGIAFFISSFVKSSEVALGISFFVWIFLLAFIDIALISLMMQQRLNEELIIFIAMINPMELFRVAAISLLIQNLPLWDLLPFTYLTLLIRACLFFCPSAILFSWD